MRKIGTRYQGTSKERLALDSFIKLNRAVNALSARIDQHSAAGDLHGSQFGTLEMLYHLGPVNQKVIGDKLLISKSNVVGVIDKLEAKGLVERQRSTEDRRCIFVHLTDAGREEIEKLLPPHVAAITQEMGYLTADEQWELGRLCRKLGLAETNSAR